MPERFIKKVAHLFTDRMGFRQDIHSDAVWGKKIIQRMQKLNIQDQQSYFRLLQTSNDEWNSFLEEVIVSETWFFREPAALVYVSKDPFFEPANILSVSCSTGEEPYSFAMMLAEKGRGQSSFSIDAIDISTKAIEKAKRGIYSQNAFRKKNEGYRRKYFKEEGAYFLLNDSIKSRVHFYVDNILDSKVVSSAKKYRFIFCRNLLMYLGVDALQKFQKIIRVLLDEKGFLFVGASEREIMARLGWISEPPLNACIFSPPPVEKHDNFQEIQVQIDAESPIEKKKQPLAEVASLADQGLHTEARALCEQYIRTSGKTDPDAYFLLGVIEHAQVEMDLAEANFLKTIYLNGEHMQALVYLALLAERRGDEEKAHLYRSRIQRLGDRHGTK